MNEEPKNNWTKSWLYAWLIIFAVVVAILIPLSLTADNNRSVTKGVIDAFPEIMVIGIVTASVIVGLWVFILWLRCWKNFRKFLFALACLFTLLLLAYAEEDWRTKRALEKFMSQQEAKGEQFDLLSIAPPAVPDDQNFAMAPIWVESLKASNPKAAQQFFGTNYAEDGQTDFVDRLSMSTTYNDQDGPALGSWQKATLTDLRPWQDYYRQLASKTKLFPVPLSPQSPAQDVLLALSKYDPAIEELRQASALPYAQFSVDYAFQPPAEILLPHLAKLRRVDGALNLRAIAELQNGQTDKALADIKLSFRLMDSARLEPFLISHLVRLAMWQTTLQPIYEGLANHQWSGAQLTDMDSQLAKIDFLADYQHSLAGEQALEFANTEYLRRTGNASMFDYSDGNHNDQFKSLVFRLLPGAFFYQNELTMLQLNQEYALSIVDVQGHSVSPSVVQKDNEAESKVLSHLSYGTVMARWLLPSFGTAVKKSAYAQEFVDLARVAIALERYRRNTGVYPDSLDVLAPNLIDEVPHDVINGDPLHYHHTNDGRFILYSVGWNQKDDGGKISANGHSFSTVDINQGDWVWRYPAN
ncbi:MAG TPA: hypothetical protein VGN23_03670 [Verrucomicrobiae bacterium]|jgi:hypothetical protein